MANIRLDTDPGHLPGPLPVPTAPANGEPHLAAYPAADRFDETTLSDLEAIRLLLLKTHYRAPLDFTKEGLREAKGNLDRWYRAIEAAEDLAATADAVAPPPGVMAALSDDVNTPGAVAELNQIAGALHDALRGGRTGDARLAAAELRAAGALLGILQAAPAE